MSRSDAARRANETRRLRSPEVEADVAILRGGHFTGVPKSEVRQEVIEFLSRYTPQGEAAGDLLGPGWSALGMHEAGLSVIAAEDCGWSARQLGNDRQRAERAAKKIAADGGFSVRIGPFSKIIPSIKTAFYDTCGPYLEPSSRDVQAMAAAGLRAFVVTVLFSRVEGMKGKPSGHYRRLAEVGLAEDAPGYHIERVREYRGENNLPMAAFFLVHQDIWWNEHIAPTLDRLHRAKSGVVKADRPAGPDGKWVPNSTTLSLASIVRRLVNEAGGVLPSRLAYAKLQGMGINPASPRLGRARSWAGVVTRPSKHGWCWSFAGTTGLTMAHALDEFDREVSDHARLISNHSLSDRFSTPDDRDRVGELATLMGVGRTQAREYARQHGFPA